jgi:hypothetical protein
MLREEDIYFSSACKRNFTFSREWNAIVIFNKKIINPKVQLTVGICAAKASRHAPGLLCRRFHDPKNVHVFIPGISILFRRTFCVQEVLMHMCLPSFYPNAFFGLMEFGPNLRMPHSRTMGDGLFELRPRGREGIGRTLYCYVNGQRIMVLHAFVKKTQETPEKELLLARKRMKEVRNG